MTHEEFLLHYGVKGMKWGVRKAARSVGRGAKRAYGATAGRAVNAVRRRKANKKYVKDMQAYAQKYKDNYIDVYNKTADWSERYQIPKINKKYTSAMLRNPKTRAKYEREYHDAFDKKLQQNMVATIGKPPKKP